MAYLDVSPLITALRNTPDEFDLSGGWLTHIGSWHSFRFGPNDQVEIRAACNCSILAIRPDQLPPLGRSFREWESEYWRPLQINREFASHFKQSWVRRVLVSLTGQFYRWLLRPPRSAQAAREAPEAG
jgi:hypothetical protein